MAKYRKKPIVIEAVQWFEGPFIDGVHLLTHEIDPHKEPSYWPHVHTMHGRQTIGVLPGDWIIPDGAPDTFYPVKPDIFTATYEAID